MTEFSESKDPSTMGISPEVTWHPPSPENKNQQDEVKDTPNIESKKYTMEDLFSHINVVERELKVELYEIKLVLNKLVMSNLDKSE